MFMFFEFFHYLSVNYVWYYGKKIDFAFTQTRLNPNTVME